VFKTTGGDVTKVKISYGSVISLAFSIEATVRLADDPLYKKEDLGLKM